jgi:hypothetical protein
MADDLKEQCFQMREQLLAFEKLRDLAQGFPDAPREAKANIMLAFRHLEDCRMRLGKAIQALDGGKSVYPR